MREPVRSEETEEGLGGWSRLSSRLGHTNLTDLGWDMIEIHLVIGFLWRCSCGFLELLHLTWNRDMSQYLTAFWQRGKETSRFLNDLAQNYSFVRIYPNDEFIEHSRTLHDFMKLGSYLKRWLSKLYIPVIKNLLCPIQYQSWCWEFRVYQSLIGKLWTPSL